MKINWGWGLAIFISIFLVAILSFVYFATTQQVNLVERDYYPKGVTYDQQIKKQQNAKALQQTIVAEQKGTQLWVSFPEKAISQAKGTIHLSHIENYKLDQRTDIALDSLGQQQINIDKLQAGRYIIKADWESANTKYYQEIKISITKN